MSLISFIRSVQPHIAKLKSLGAESIALIVTGNESADLDSCASSVLTAYFYSSDRKGKKFDAILPLINMPRSDFAARPDIVYLFESLGLKSEHLMFQEDLYSLHKSKVRLSAFLVDHNRLVHDHETIFGDSVVGIIDHHADEELYKRADPRIIEKCGSCSSLVVNYFKSRVNTAVFSDRNLGELAISPGLIDTSVLKHRVEQPDIDSFEFLRMHVSLDETQLFTTLNQKKKDLDLLSVDQIFRKDFKSWEGRFRIGISSVPQPMEYLEKRAENLPKVAADYAKKRDLDIFTIMTSFSRGDKFCREIAFYGRTPEARDAVLRMIEEVESELQLKNVQSNGDLILFNQNNVASSRKQVAPLLRASLSR